MLETALKIEQKTYFEVDPQKNWQILSKKKKQSFFVAEILRIL